MSSLECRRPWLVRALPGIIDHCTCLRKDALGLPEACPSPTGSRLSFEEIF